LYSSRVISFLEVFYQYAKYTENRGCRLEASAVFLLGVFLLQLPLCRATESLDIGVFFLFLNICSRAFSFLLTIIFCSIPTSL
jgi:hypothetical protein